MTVPEATVHEDRLPSRAENDVGTAWEIASVESVSIAESVEQASHHHLGLGIFWGTAAIFLERAAGVRLSTIVYCRCAGDLYENRQLSESDALAFGLGIGAARNARINYPFACRRCHSNSFSATRDRLVDTRCTKRLAIDSRKSHIQVNV